MTLTEKIHKEFCIAHLQFFEAAQAAAGRPLTEAEQVDAASRLLEKVSLFWSANIAQLCLEDRNRILEVYKDSLLK